MCVISNTTNVQHTHDSLGKLTWVRLDFLSQDKISDSLIWCASSSWWRGKSVLWHLLVILTFFSFNSDRLNCAKHLAFIKSMIAIQIRISFTWDHVFISVLMYKCFVCFDFSRHSQHFCLLCRDARLNQNKAADKVSCSRTQHSDSFGGESRTSKKRSMIRKYHNHKLLTNPWHHEEELQDIYSNKASKRQ